MENKTNILSLIPRKYAKRKIERARNLRARKEQKQAKWDKAWQELEDTLIHEGLIHLGN